MYGGFDLSDNEAGCSSDTRFKLRDRMLRLFDDLPMAPNSPNSPTTSDERDPNVPYSYRAEFDKIMYDTTDYGDGSCIKKMGDDDDDDDDKEEEEEQDEYEKEDEKSDVEMSSSDDERESNKWEYENRTCKKNNESMATESETEAAKILSTIHEQPLYSEKALRNSPIKNIIATNTSSLNVQKDDSTSGRQSLNAFASAALKASIHDHGFNDCTMDVEPIELNDKIVKIAEEDKWNTVGIFKTLTHNVINYVDYDEWNSNQLQLNGENIPDLTSYTQVPLEQGKAYRFRVAGINSVGIGEYSELQAFRTVRTGFPGPSSGVKISKSSDVVHLSWVAPSLLSGKILEYSVYLAVNTQVKMKTKKMSFVCVYCGPENQCDVSKKFMSTAHVDTTSKPANLFRIAAKNDRGYGPITQVRWVQDPQAFINKSLKRPIEKSESLSSRAKKIRDDEH